MLLILPLNPVPASRPRVSKWGTYYAKTYNRFRKQAEHVVPVAIMEQGLEGCPLTGPLSVDLKFFVRKPKKTALQYPKPDIDNFYKAVLDSLNGKLFVDDQQVIQLTGSKTWAEPEQDGWIEVTVEDY
tara:strand:+ start:17 stop:400 length:384 start_codon:yes stop_codon:yes gene_type:complete